MIATSLGNNVILQTWAYLRTWRERRSWRPRRAHRNCSLAWSERSWPSRTWVWARWWAAPCTTRWACRRVPAWPPGRPSRWKSGRWSGTAWYTWPQSSRWPSSSTTTWWCGTRRCSCWSCTSATSCWCSRRASSARPPKSWRTKIRSGHVSIRSAIDNNIMTLILNYVSKFKPK